MLVTWQTRVSKHTLCVETHDLDPAADDKVFEIKDVSQNDRYRWSGLWRYECENRQHSTLMPSSVQPGRQESKRPTPVGSLVHDMFRSVVFSYIIFNI